MGNKKRYVYENHSNDILKQMSLERADKSLCYVEIIVGDSRFVCSVRWRFRVVLTPEYQRIEWS